ncbi:MAG TPA: NADH-quinone oxidoreductase subunit J [Candidatus Polarisedimenticolaceae bacterium]|nr:NADH-quinone oxidoreductase subunit J [Candidatus Polarisedimenticolaceae bacterium]
MRDAAFWSLSVLLLGAAAAVVTARSLIRAAFALAGSLLATAALYLLLTSPLLAAVQVLLYTGGVLTLVVFALVVAGANEPAARFRKPLPAGMLALAVFAALASAIGTLPAGPGVGGLESGRDVGLALFGDYLVPFELLSVLLLAAVFGALLLARRERAS